MKSTLNKLIRGEKGQALILVLVLMLLGGLILAPLLAYMSTGLKVGKEVYEERMYGQYAADAGVEDALYKIRTDDPALPDEWEGVWTRDAYDTSFTYSTPQLNGNNVGVTIQPYFTLTGLEDPPQGMTPHADIVVVGDTVGSVGDNGLYQISINYDRSKGELTIERIGAWLPAGYNYVTGSSNLEQAPPGKKYYSVPVVVPYRGGQAIIWNYSAPRPKFEDFPGDGDKRIVTFEFTPNQSPVSAFSWVVAQRQDIYLSWDVDIKIYQITSQATDADSGKSITVEAYVSRNEMRELGSATLGDYCAVGGTLLTTTTDQYYRDRLYMQSSATIQSTDPTAPGYIPSGATVQAAYLYWSGWIDYRCKEKYKQGQNWYWRWKDMPELKYPTNPTLQKLTDLVETAAKVNRVTLLFGSGDPVTITVTNSPPLSKWQVKENTSQAGTWSYSCFYNATALVKQLIEDGKLGSNSSGTYTVKHVPEDRSGYSGESPNYSFGLYNTGQYTGYPLGTPADKLPDGQRRQAGEWAYAGWSLIIIYSSPETKGHQLYLYDDFRYCDNNETLQFPISGFLAPEEIRDELYAAHLTCFVGEGDEVYPNDYIKVNGANLSNSASPANNVWNSKSPGLAVDGVDVDTFTVGYPTIKPGDTSAQVELPTGTDSWNLVYIIISFRSNIKTSGAISYIYVGGG